MIDRLSRFIFTSNSITAVALITTLLASSTTLAAAPASGNAPGGQSGFQCWPSLHDTNWVAQKAKGEIRVTIDNPGGYETMPQIEGPVSSSQLPFYQMQAEDLSILGGRFTLSWNETDCETFDPGNRWLICSKPGRVSIAGVTVLTASSYKVTEENPNGRFVTHKLRLTLERLGNTYFVTFVFPEKSCRAL